MSLGGLVSRFSDGLNGEFFTDFADEFFGGKAVQVFYNSVVIHYFKLIAGEKHGKKTVKFLAAVIIGELLSAFKTDLNGGGGSVMTVGNV